MDWTYSSVSKVLACDDEALGPMVPPMIPAPQRRKQQEQGFAAASASV